jgi:hypothetical protein
LLEVIVVPVEQALWAVGREFCVALDPEVCELLPESVEIVPTQKRRRCQRRLLDSQANATTWW